MSKPQELILTEKELQKIQLAYDQKRICNYDIIQLIGSNQTQVEYIKALELSVKDIKRYKTALSRIVCLNIPMPDNVFNLANNALEGVETN